MRIQLALSLSVFALQFALLGLPAKAQTPPTVAGSIPGQFAVSESGAATYRIPIQVPPGVAGMQPKLELVYNSQGGNGLLGMGWSLSGLSAIARCPRTMASDGVRGGVNFDLNDRYCLDGQRLILVSGTEGTAGAEYRTERESFSKITAYGSAGNGPAYFIVKTKAGLTMEYGNTEDARIEAVKAAGSNATWPTGTVRAWAQNKVSDVKGNYYTTTYTEDSTNGEYYPDRMDYAGNAASAPLLMPTASVKFVPTSAARLDPQIHYQAGAEVKTKQRIGSLKTYIDNTQVAAHNLTYEMGGVVERSRVSSYQFCGIGAVCFSALEFQYAASIDPPFQSPRVALAHTASGSFVDYETQVMDVNGDGLPDLVNILKSTSGWYAYVAIGNGDGTFQSPRVGLAHTASGSFSGYETHVMDVNGDGLADLANILKSTNGWYAYVAIDNGNVDRLHGISSGGRSLLTLKGGTLTDNTVYTKDLPPNAAVYPKVDLQYPLYVVSRVEQSNGVGGVTATEYKYGGLKAELGTGRGLLGFRWMSAKNLATGVESYTEYRQDYPYTGIPLKNETRLTGAGNGGVLKRSSTTVACQIPQTAAVCTVAAGNRYFPYVAQSVEESWDLGGLPYPSITSSYVYGQSPQYGDPTQITVGTSDGASKTTVNEYWPADTANWILGRLRRATVTSSKP